MMIGRVSHWPIWRPVRGREVHELDVRLATIFDAEAEQAVADRGDAEELARLVARVGLPEEEGEDGEQYRPSRPAS